MLRRGFHIKQGRRQVISLPDFLTGHRSHAAAPVGFRAGREADQLGHRVFEAPKRATRPSPRGVEVAGKPGLVLYGTVPRARPLLQLLFDAALAFGGIIAPYRIVSKQAGVRGSTG